MKKDLSLLEGNSDSMAFLYRDRTFPGRWWTIDLNWLSANRRLKMDKQEQADSALD